MIPFLDKKGIAILLWALKEIKRFIFVECGEFCCFSSLTTLYHVWIGLPITESVITI
ncbi:hypothetical protein CLOSYM_00041 [[Clostridium] symbiosum ATCC 14940]|uniref:Uncharacterized protein n=1 Tax=[Clostridium] symbiosum ATCC 14940 TaxID=411472 RepID=A0ABC9U588_CLOSY|nr:hypothetical protein CLOSYM_00041 [[Clostridium] symbiosum ATCC 14940]